MARIRVLRNRFCTKNGCEDWERAVTLGQPYADCAFCGFNITESERRKQIPLTENGVGLLRKKLSTKVEGY